MKKSYLFSQNVWDRCVFLRISDITKEFTEKCILLEYLPSFDISTPPMQCSSSAETAEPIRQNYCQSYSYSTATSFDISTSPLQQLNQLNKTIVKENIIHQPAQKTDDTLVRFRWDKKTTYRLRWHSFWHLCSKVVSALVIWFNIPIWNFHSWILQEPTHYRTGIFQCYDELNINLIFNVYIIFWG